MSRVIMPSAKGKEVVRKTTRTVKKKRVSPEAAGKLTKIRSVVPLQFLDGLHAKKGRPIRNYGPGSSRVHSYEDDDSVVMSVNPKCTVPRALQLPSTASSSTSEEDAPAEENTHPLFPPLEIIFEAGSTPTRLSKAKEVEILLQAIDPSLPRPKRHYTRRIEPIDAVELLINQTQIVKAETRIAPAPGATSTSTSSRTQLQPPLSLAPLFTSRAHDSARLSSSSSSIESLLSSSTSPGTTTTNSPFLAHTSPFPLSSIPPGLVSPASLSQPDSSSSGTIFLPPPVLPSMPPCNVPVPVWHDIQPFEYSRPADTSAPVLYMWDATHGFYPTNPLTTPPHYDPFVRGLE